MSFYSSAGKKEDKRGSHHFSVQLAVQLSAASFGTLVVSAMRVMRTRSGTANSCVQLSLLSCLCGENCATKAFCGCELGSVLRKYTLGLNSPLGRILITAPRFCQLLLLTQKSDRHVHFLALSWLLFENYTRSFGIMCNSYSFCI